MGTGCSSQEILQVTQEPEVRDGSNEIVRSGIP